MPYIARTDGGQTVLELREGVLADIADADRINWRVVLEPNPINVDNLTQVMTTFDFVVSDNGAIVTKVWKVENTPDVLNKRKLMDYAAARSWQKRTAGLTLPNGVRVDTSAESLTNIIGAVLSLERGIIQEPISFCALSGHVQVTLEDLKGVWAAIAIYAQASFAARAKCLADIDAGTITTSAQVDAVI